MAVLSDHTGVRHPDTLLPVALAAGTEVPEWAEGMVGDHLLVADDEAASEPEGYESLQKADLKAEIERRNADRDDADKIEPESDKNADLVAALVADDEAQA